MKRFLIRLRQIVIFSYFCIVIIIIDRMKKQVVAIVVALCAVVCSVKAQDSDYIRYIDKYKDVAIEQMRKYHIPASITLAQALLESGAGKSELARNSNNHFGIKCHSWILLSSNIFRFCFRNLLRNDLLNDILLVFLQIFERFFEVLH